MVGTRASLAFARRSRFNIGIVAKPIRPAPRHRPGPVGAAEFRRRHARILAAAMKVFMSHGYVDTSIYAVVERSGHCRETIQLHFGSKAELFKAVLEAGDPARTLRPIEIAEGSTPLEILLQYAQQIQHAQLSAKGIAFMRMLVAERVHFPELTAAAGRRGFETLRSLVAEALRELAARGRMEIFDSNLAAEQFLDILIGMRGVQGFFGWPGLRQERDRLEAKVKLFLAGLPAEQAA